MKTRIPFIMTCKDFQLRTGAEPSHLGWSQRLHRLMCGACRFFATDVRRLDRRLSAAFKLDATVPDPDRRLTKHSRDE
jgi:hypothetical protein